MKPVVRIVDQPSYEPQEIRGKVRGLIEADGLRLRGRSVFVKPSFVYPARPPLNRGVNTQPEFVGGVVQALKDLGASRVWVGEDSLAGPSETAFYAMGVLPFLRGAAEPAYLKREARAEAAVPDPLVESRFRLPKKLLDADLFISLPKIKVNIHSGLTLSAKNHMGLLLLKDRLANHDSRLHAKIADLFLARRPDYVLADAIMAGEGQGPMHARPVSTAVIVAGRNGVAVDSVCCRLMGFEAGAVPHLVYLHEKGIGPISSSEIEIEGESLLRQRSRGLLSARVDFADYPPSIRVLVGTEKACPEGCLGMVRGTLDHWASRGRWRSLEGVRIIVGKRQKEEIGPGRRGRTFVVGDCAAEYGHLGTYMPGCPIPPLALLFALARSGIVARPLTARLSNFAAAGLMRLNRRPVGIGGLEKAPWPGRGEGPGKTQN